MDIAADGPVVYDADGHAVRIHSFDMRSAAHSFPECTITFYPEFGRPPAHGVPSWVARRAHR